MSIKIFLTGATGYIGGDALRSLYIAHPEYSFSLLVRDENSKQQVAAQYPNATFVIGNLDDTELLVSEAAKADIVLHTADASDHKRAAEAIAKGLAIGHTEDSPGFWLHTSGTGILCWKDMETGTYGEAPLPDQAYDDLEGIDRLTNLPDSAWHRDVDKVVLEAGAQAKVKTAIVCPPTIYGQGRGPGNTRSKQVPLLVKATLEEKRPLQLGAGKTEWDHVHVHDLSALFVLLAEAAASKRLDGELWGNKHGYYFAENGTHVWSELSKAVGDVAKVAGHVETTEMKVLSKDEAEKSLGMQALTWGLNSKGKALRAKKVLEWKPVGQSLKAVLSELVESEASLLGLKKGSEIIA